MDYTTSLDILLPHIEVYFDNDRVYRITPFIHHVAKLVKWVNNDGIYKCASGLNDLLEYTLNNWIKTQSSYPFIEAIGPKGRVYINLNKAEYLACNIGDTEVTLNDVEYEPDGSNIKIKHYAYFELKRK